MMMRFGLMVVLVVLAAPVQAQDASALIAQGRRVFQDQGCYGCHMVGKTGTPIGPDLSHIGATHNRSYFNGWLRDPSRQRPTAHMSKITLTDAEVQALSAYLESLR